MGYSLLDEIPHFITVSYAFANAFPELSEEIFAHILNKALNNRMVDLHDFFIDGTYIKTSAGIKEVAEGTGSPRPQKVYEEQLRKRYPRNENNWVRKSTMMMMTKKIKVRRGS